jgi:predicted anti-sigma-YlaC factor YlaD
MNSNAHLNDPQLYSQLENEAGDTAIRGHLLACAACREEVDTLRNSLLNFRTAATNYSLLHAPTRLRMNLAPERRFFTVTRAAWATGLVAAMALCTASVSLIHKTPAAVQPVVTASAAGTARPADAQSDDALLQDIDSDLSTSVPPSLQPLDVTSASETNATSSSN